MSVFAKIIYGLQVAVIGLLVVFAGLAILIGTVTLMGYLMKRSNDKKEAKVRAEMEAAQRAAEGTAPVAAEPEPIYEDVTDDTELVAVIAAAIAAFDNSGRALVVRKVRRVAGWNRAARAEQVYRF